MSEDIAIKVNHVSKDFRFSSHRSNTIKSIFTGITHKKNKDEKIQHALKDINFEIKKGEFFGIVGRNGSGKSTLLKIMAGIYQPNKGNVQVSGRLVPFIELGVGFNPDLTGKENVYMNGAILGFSTREINVFYKEVVEFAELEKFMDKKLKNYSSGMQVRLAFSMAIRAKADVLLIDEVLAVGDADFQRKCYEYFRTLKKNKMTVVFVSHSMDAVRQFCDRGVLVDNSKLIASGSADEIATKYTRMFTNSDLTSSSSEQSRTWGDRVAKFLNVITEVDDSTGVVRVKTKLKSKETIENVSTGIMIRNTSGQVILGSNSVIEGHINKTFAKGKVYDVEWTIPNIFNDDTYSVDLAISYNDGVMAQWLQEASIFKIKLETSTPFIVNPKLGFILSEE